MGSKEMQKVNNLLTTVEAEKLEPIWFSDSLNKQIRTTQFLSF